MRTVSKCLSTLLLNSTKMHITGQRPANLIDPGNCFVTFFIFGVIQCVMIHRKALKNADNKVDTRGQRKQHAMSLSFIAFKPTRRNTEVAYQTQHGNSTDNQQRGACLFHVDLVSIRPNSTHLPAENFPQNNKKRLAEHICACVVFLCVVKCQLTISPMEIARGKRVQRRHLALEPLVLHPGQC